MEENMLKNNINDEIIIETSAHIANKVGLDNLSLKMIAEELNIKSPSLYNHISSLDEIKSRLMVYGWKQMEEKMIDSAVGVSGYEALRNMCYAFYDYSTNNKGVFTAMLWYNKYESEELIYATEKIYIFFFMQTDRLGIERTVANHLLRTYRAFLEGFSLLVIHNSFGNPISVDESFDISLNVLLNGIE